jgi:hypothetical protein
VGDHEVAIAFHDAAARPALDILRLLQRRGVAPAGTASTPETPSTPKAAATLTANNIFRVDSSSEPPRQTSPARIRFHGRSR